MKFSLRKRLKSLASGLLAVAFLATGLGLEASMFQASAAGSAPVVYDVQDCYSLSSLATMTVNGVNVPIIKFLNLYDHAQFSFPFPETATIELTFNEDIETYSVSPLAKNIEATPNGKKLTFSITESIYMIVKVNGIKEIVIVADDVESDVPAATGDGIYNLVADYGADPTGTDSATALLQQAIDDAAVNGGITYVPTGLYKLDGNIELPSNTKLYLEGGAVIRCTATPENFESYATKNIIYMASYSSIKRYTTWVFRTALGADNIKIYGRGTVDGNGSALYTGTISNGEGWANTLFYLRQCTNFSMDGITVKDCSYWTIETKLSEHMTFTNLKVLNDFDNMTENDAIDVCESRHVLVKHMLAISEDDTYSTKTYTASGVISSKGETSVYSDYTLDAVTFDDCFGWTNCATFKVGDGSNYTQSNVTFKNSYSYKCMQAIKVHHAYGGDDYTNIVFDNIDIEGYGGRSLTDRRWFLLDTFSGSESDPGNITGVTVRNINIRDLGTTKSVISGNGTSGYVTGLRFENIKVPGLPEGQYASTLAEMNITNVDSYDTSDYVILPDDNSNRSGTDYLGALDAAIRLAERDYKAGTLRKHTPATAAAFEAALANAKTVFANNDSANAASATTKLKNAISGLVTRESVSPALVNLALNKSVTASGSQSGSAASKAVDGSTGSCWRSQTTGNGPYWIYVDLGASKNFDKLYVSWEDCFGMKFKFQYSDDAVNWTDITINDTVWQGCYKKSSQTFFLDQLYTGRYVRLYAYEKATVYGMGVYEFGIYDQSVVTTPGMPCVVGMSDDPDTNLALNGTVIDCGASTYSSTSVPSQINDATTTSGGYQTASYSSGQWVGVEFDYTHELAKLVLYWETDAYVSSYADKGFEIYLLINDQWVALASAATNVSATRTSTSDMGSCKVYDTITFDNISAAGVKVEFLNGNITDHKYAPKLMELEVFPGESTGVSPYITSTSVTLDPVDGCEYSRDGVTWQSSNEFTDLTPATTYTFYQRYAATDFTSTSTASKGLEVTTLAEGEVPAPDPTPDTTVHYVSDTNLALNKTITATSSDENYPASNAVDGSTSTRWGRNSSQKNNPHTFVVDLGDLYAVNKVHVQWNGANNAPGTYSIETSTDGTNWTTVVATKTPAADATVTTDLFDTIAARYVRLSMTTNASTQYLSIQELEVYWEETTLEPTLLGDLSLDGLLGAADMTILSRHISGIGIITDEQVLANADVTADGSVDASDLTKLSRVLARIEKI